MATVDGTWDGREWTAGKDGSASVTLYVHFDPDTEDEEDIEAAALAELPDTYLGYFLTTISLRPHAWSMYKAVGKYSQRPKPDTSGGADPEFSFEIATSQVKVLSSLAVISSGVASGKTIPDNGTLIGVQKDGTIEGLEVPQSTYSFSEMHHFNNAAITTAYKVVLAGLVGTVNFGAGFRGFAAGEVLCTGVSGSQKGSDLWQIRFKWEVLPNISGLTVGPISSITKAGWDYLEWFTQEKENVTDKKIERELTGYRVHRVLREGDFSDFGIGS